MQDEYVTKSKLKTEYELTDSLIKKLGAPDAEKANPMYKSAAPMQLYLRERVAAWCAENSDLIEKARQRRKHARKAVETKRQQGRGRLASLLAQLQLKPIPARQRLENQVANFLFERYGTSEVSEKAVCSYLRHNYTNYESILRDIRGVVGKGQLYADAKLYITCIIIRHYKLNIHPMTALHGAAADETHPAEKIEAELKEKLGA